MAPIVHGLESEFYPNVNFVYLNIDDPATSSLKAALSYRYQPHFFLIDGEGNVLQQWLGPVGEEEFRQALNSALE